MNHPYNVLILTLTIIGSFCCSLFLLPQFIKIVKNKSASDLSLFANILALICGICWVVYLTWKALYFENDRFEKIILIISSISDWGICIIDTMILIYQINWLKKNKDLYRVKSIVKKMTNKELLDKIHELEQELGVEVEHG
ncbi:PQ-loop repeat-containing protein [Spiroplasma endosymbiont of Aspidapion aeneum]|uniref:PQ-loop repeat-containing protein n=1 Tax=Spiroplasma endosymbiont of Aspidapion aeneum TaxID=3066276 RepID=UPI00313B225C